MPTALIIRARICQSPVCAIWSSYPPRRHAKMTRQTASTVKPGLVTRDELKRQEREAIIAALKQTNGKVSGPGGAAELLGLKPSTLASRIWASIAGRWRADRSSRRDV